MTRRRRIATALLAGAVGLQTVQPAAAHAGTTHAGTPHWLLLVVALLGLGLVAVGVRHLRGAATHPRLASLAIAGGVVGSIFGGIGLVEIQVTPDTAPTWTEFFPVFNLVVAALLALGSLVVVFWRWRDRPRYVALGLLLSAWIAYPAVMPAGGLNNPLGYVIVLAVPLAVGYVLAIDAGARLRAAVADTASRVAAGLAVAAFSIFFAFSAGALTLSPDTTPAMHGEGFVTFHDVAAPLVYWPTVQYYFPSIPASGYVSVGLLVLVGLLGGLIALNAGLAVRQWRAAGSVESPRAMLGTLTASGATACCCCAPALYGLLGAAAGTAASPVYWAFMDPTSPVGGLFLAASVLLLTGSAIRTAADPACRIPPGEGDAGVPEAGGPVQG